MLSKAALLAFALLSSVAAAEPLTIRPGESWVFTVEGGQPANARRVSGSVKPKRGEIKASLLAALGTSMTLSNNSPTAYTFKAQLIGVPAGPPARTCTLPANGAPALEYWPQKASAVRIGDFKPAPGQGRC